MILYSQDCLILGLFFLLLSFHSWSEVDTMLYAKSIFLENIYPWWCCPFNIYYTSLSSTTAIFLTTHSCGSDATIQIFCLLWQRYFHLTQSPMAESYSYQCLATETSTWGKRGYTAETLSIFYIIYLYIRLVVIL